jgi:hypothetical protein
MELDNFFNGFEEQLSGFGDDVNNQLNFGEDFEKQLDISDALTQITG